MGKSTTFCSMMFKLMYFVWQHRLISIYQLLCHTIVYGDSCLCNVSLRADLFPLWCSAACGSPLPQSGLWSRADEQGRHLYKQGLMGL